MVKRLGELLIAHGAARPEDVVAALKRQSAGDTRRLGQILLEAEAVDPTRLARALGEMHDVPFTELFDVNPAAGALLSPDFLAENRMVPFALEETPTGERILLAVEDPGEFQLVDELRFQLHRAVKVFVAPVDQIHRAIEALRIGAEAIEPIALDDEVAIEGELVEEDEGEPIIGIPADEPEDVAPLTGGESPFAAAGLDLGAFDAEDDVPLLQGASIDVFAQVPEEWSDAAEEQPVVRAPPGTEAASALPTRSRIEVTHFARAATDSVSSKQARSMASLEAVEVSMDITPLPVNVLADETARSTPAPVNVLADETTRSTLPPANPVADETTRSTLPPANPVADETTRSTPPPANPVADETTRSTPAPVNPVADETARSTPAPVNVLADETTRSTLPPVNPVADETTRSTPAPVNPFADETTGSTPPPANLVADETTRSPPAPVDSLSDETTCSTAAPVDSLADETTRSPPPPVESLSDETTRSTPAPVDSLADETTRSPPAPVDSLADETTRSPPAPVDSLSDASTGSTPSPVESTALEPTRSTPPPSKVGGEAGESDDKEFIPPTDSEAAEILDAVLGNWPDADEIEAHPIADHHRDDGIVAPTAALIEASAAPDETDALASDHASTASELVARTESPDPSPSSVTAPTLAPSEADVALSKVASTTPAAEPTLANPASADDLAPKEPTNIDSDGTASDSARTAPEDQVIPTEPGLTPTQPGLTPTQPGLTPTQPGLTPTQPGLPPTQPGLPPTQPGLPPTQPGLPPTQPGLTPTQPGLTPTEPEATASALASPASAEDAGLSARSQPEAAPPASESIESKPSVPQVATSATRDALEFSEEDLAILDAIERLAGGDESLSESEKVKPARMVAALTRLLMKKGVIDEHEFLDELARK